MCTEDTQIQQMPRAPVLLWYSVHALLSNFNYFVEQGNKYSEKFFPCDTVLNKIEKLKKKPF